MNILTRVEEEKAINRALSGIPLPTNVDSNRQKSPPPAPVSRFRRENHLFLPEHIKWWHSAQNTKVFGQAGRQLPESPGRHQWSNSSSSSSPFLPLSPSVISPSGRPGWVGGGVFECPSLFSPPFPFVPPNFPRLWQLIKAWCWDNNCYQLHPFTPMCHRLTAPFTTIAYDDELSSENRCPWQAMMCSMSVTLTVKKTSLQIISKLDHAILIACQGENGLS